MKIFEKLKNAVTAAYYAGYAFKVVSRIFLKEFFPFEEDTDFYDRYPPIEVGRLVETDKHDKIPATETLFGNKTKLVAAATNGWVIDKYVDKNRPGSIVVYRILFPEGVFWVSQCWIREK